jgi:hypothetical protein
LLPLWLFPAAGIFNDSTHPRGHDVFAHFAHHPNPWIAHLHIALRCSAGTRRSMGGGHSLALSRKGCGGNGHPESFSICRRVTILNYPNCTRRNELQTSLRSDHPTRVQHVEAMARVNLRSTMQDGLGSFSNSDLL